MIYQQSRNHPNPALRREKLAQAILFFLSYPSMEQLGKTKLMKLLYFADFDHFERFAESITGARYRRLEHGPVPDDAWQALDDMVASGRLNEEQVPQASFSLTRYTPAEKASLTIFDQDERETLVKTAERFKLFTTKQIEAVSHTEAPWIAVNPNEIIPYHLAYYRNTYGELDPEENESAVLPTEDEVFAREVLEA